MTNHLSLAQPAGPEDPAAAAAAQAAVDAAALMARVADGKDHDELARAGGFAGRRLVEVLGGGDVRVSALARVLRAAGYELELRAVPTDASSTGEPDRLLGTHLGQSCPKGPHRGPEGPNEDLATCPRCGRMSWALRPEGETLGLHADDCSLPRRHEGHCTHGGSGHAPAALVRGFWPGMEDDIAAARARHEQDAAA